jgi:hypothetical protein
MQREAYGDPGGDPGPCPNNRCRRNIGLGEEEIAEGHPGIDEAEGQEEGMLDPFAAVVINEDADDGAYKESNEGNDEDRRHILTRPSFTAWDRPLRFLKSIGSPLPSVNAMAIRGHLPPESGANYR